MRLIVPKPPGADPDEPPLRHYKMRMLDKSVKNALVLTDKPKSPDSENRARESSTGAPQQEPQNVLTLVLGLTVLRGALEHDFNIEAMYNRNYSARMRARREKAEPRGRVMILEKQKDFDQAGINRLNAGIVSRSASSTAFSHALGKQPPKPKGQFERMARIAKIDLIDMLFKLFSKQQYWSLKDLRAKVQQPEAYLKEVLAEIGHLERSGPNNGTWRLQESYAMAIPEAKEDEMEVEGSQPGIKMDPVKMEYNLEPSQNNSEFDYGEPDDEEDDEDDEDEDEMEEVE